MIRVAGRENDYDILRAEREAPAVMAAIHAYDPQLLVGWDSSACRWSLLRVSRGGYHFIGVLETDTKQYRPLDTTVLDDLLRWDLWAMGKTPQQVAHQWEDEEQARADKSEADFRDDISYATRWNSRTLHRLTRLVGL